MSDFNAGKYDPNRLPNLNANQDASRKTPPDESAGTEPTVAPTDPYAEQKVSGDAMLNMMAQMSKTSGVQGNIQHAGIQSSMEAFSQLYPPERIQPELDGYHQGVTSDPVGRRFSKLDQAVAASGQFADKHFPMEIQGASA